MQGNTLVGYILFTNVKRKFIIKINHFCIEKSFRKHGIGKDLFVNFKKSIIHAFYIELSCRDDYDINDFWSKIGFSLIDARAGRASNELSILHRFQYKLQENITDIINDSDIRPKVLLDSSIVFSIESGKSNEIEENLLFMYANDVQFCVAPAIYKDMKKQNDDNIKLKSIEKANMFTTLSTSCNKYKYALSKIRLEFPKISDSDSEQLACGITNNIRHFITKDKQLLGLFKEFADQYNILIQSIPEFYSYLYFTLDKKQQTEEWLPTTHGKLIDIQLNKAELRTHYLNHANGETRQHFDEKFNIDIHNSSLKSIVIEDKQYGVLYYTIKKDVLTIRLLRLLRSYNNPNIIYDISSFIFGELIQLTLKKGISIIIFSDEYANQNTVLAAIQHGFIGSQKLSHRFIGNLFEFQQVMRANFCNSILQTAHHDFLSLSTEADVFELIEFERRYFPAKFIDINIPTYIIPIRSSWAKNLLTPEIDQQYSLTPDATKYALLTYNNVYYSSATTKLFSPARILWYVTSENRNKKNVLLQWEGHIIATSYLDEVHVGNKEKIFKKFWKMGVYRWSDIARHSDGLCTAIVFSKTEILEQKIKYNVVEDTVKQIMGQGLTLVSPTLITNEVYLSLYKKGFNCE